MKAGKYPLAVTRFTKLQHAYPKSPLSEPAEYFAANALFETGSYDQAILAVQRPRDALSEGQVCERRVAA